MVESPESVGVDVLRSLSASYPYFSLPDALIEKYHGTELSDDERKSLRLHLAVTCGDRKALYDFATEEGADFAGIYPPVPTPETVTTDNALDTFFANYGTVDKAETELLERLIFNPVPDYAEILAQEEAPCEDMHDDADGMLGRIDAFIRDRAKVEGGHIDTLSFDTDVIPEPVQPPTRPKVVETVASPPESSLLSESLAKIFIKQGRYERAYEIISNLSLNYPKKSIYFADQLRFLQKLIKIQQVAGDNKSKNE